MGQEPRSGSWEGAHGRVLLTGFILIVHFSCFIIRPETHRIGMVPPTLSLTFPHQPLIRKKKYHKAFPITSSYGNIFTIESLSSLTVLSGVKLKNLCPVLSLNARLWRCTKVKQAMEVVFELWRQQWRWLTQRDLQTLKNVYFHSEYRFPPHVVAKLSVHNSAVYWQHPKDFLWSRQPCISGAAQKLTIEI